MTHHTATITTEHGNTAIVNLAYHAQEQIAGVGPINGELPDADRIAAALDGRSFDSWEHLNVTIGALLLNSADVWVPVVPARRCQICGDVEETCDCVMLGDDVVDALRTMADGGRTPTEAEAEALRDLLVERDLLVRRDGGGWMLAQIPEGEWLDLVAEVTR